MTSRRAKGRYYVKVSRFSISISQCPSPCVKSLPYPLIPGDAACCFLLLSLSLALGSLQRITHIYGAYSWTKLSQT